MVVLPTEFYVNDEYVVTVADIVAAFIKLGWDCDEFEDAIFAEWTRQEGPDYVSGR